MADFVGPDPSMPILRSRVHGEQADRFQLLGDGTILKGDGSGSLSVESVGLAPMPSGGDDTAAVFAVAGANNKVRLRGGTPANPVTYKLNLGTLTRFDIEGQGADVTFIQPASSTAPIVAGGAAGNKADDRARLAHLSLSMPADRPYDKPLVDFTLSRNALIEDVRADVDTRIGTLFRFNSAYQFTFRNVHLRTGRYVVPVEFLNTTDLPGVGPGAPQCDTMLFEQFVVDGCIGAIFRNANGGTGATGEVHGVGFDGFKVTQSTFYGTAPAEETTLSAAHSAAGSSLTVAATTGIVPGDVLVIDPGRDTCEIVKVSGVSGTVALDSNTPLRFAHASGAEVIRGGVMLSVADGYSDFTFERWHSEGQQVGAALGNVRGVVFIAPYFGCGQHIRVCDATREIHVLCPVMRGTVNKNELLRRSSNNAASADGQWVCEDPIVPVGAPITPIIIGGYFPHGTRNWEWVGSQNGVRVSYSNAQVSNAQAKRYSVGVNGSGPTSDSWSILYGGVEQFVEQAADPAAGGANTARLYARDNGSGKTQLCVRFPTGAVQVIATEP